MLARRLAASIVLAATVTLAGCGLGPHAGTSGVTITLTRDFGAQTIKVIHLARSSRSLTPLALLEHTLAVRARTSGSITSIDGIAAAPGQSWSEFVNGVGLHDSATAQLGPKADVVHPGDQLWWDLHDSESSPDPEPAVVGAFPEPFKNGTFGRRFPTTLECAADAGAACARVAMAMEKAGVPAATQELGTGSGGDTIGVLVGTWSDLKATILAALLDAGPKVSGIYARFTADGTRLELLNGAGQAVNTIGPDAGLVAAARDSQSAAPTWIVTGTDLAGLQLAANALTDVALERHYAVAATPSGAIALPAR
jgi:hypothetical protein